MPELPDLTVYQERLDAEAAGQALERLTIGNPFVLRTVAPRPDDFAGRRFERCGRIGKRLVLRFAGAHFAVIHLMRLGRLQWRPAAAAPGRALAAFRFASGQLQLTESGSRHRASLHLVAGEDALAPFDRGGLEVPGAGAVAFDRALRRDNLTLKRALTEPAVLAGIGNAYSDEILHRARLSPFRLTGALTDEEMRRLWQAAQAVLAEWTARLRAEAGAGWPKKVTAFRPGMAVHGRFGEPCPVCGAKVQRVVHADRTFNYCPGCQTGGRILADRALSRLLRDGWPRHLDELE